MTINVTGHGDPLVLIHGLATTAHVWSAVVPALSRERTVVTLDVPGFGASAPAGPGFDLGQVADRIARSLTARGIQAPFDLVGHSLGGAIALTLAARRPALVRRLILVAPAGLEPLPRPASVLLPGLAPGLHAARRYAAPLAASPWGRRLLLAFTAADGAQMTQRRARSIVDASATATRTGSALRAVIAADMRPLLRESRAPVGVIWGEADRTIPARGARALLHVRPDAELELVPRAGHVLMLERPAAFVAALGRLMDRLPTN